MSQELPKGYNCTKCGNWHTYGKYVFAHWDIRLHHWCPTCRTQHIIYRGIQNKACTAAVYGLFYQYTNRNGD